MWPSLDFSFLMHAVLRMSERHVRDLVTACVERMVEAPPVGALRRPRAWAARNAPGVTPVSRRKNLTKLVGSSNPSSSLMAAARSVRAHRAAVGGGGEASGHQVPLLPSIVSGRPRRQTADPRRFAPGEIDRTVRDGAPPAASGAHRSDMACPWMTTRHHAAWTRRRGDLHGPAPRHPTQWGYLGLGVSDVSARERFATDLLGLQCNGRSRRHA